MELFFRRRLAAAHCRDERTQRGCCRADCVRVREVQRSFGSRERLPVAEPERGGLVVEVMAEAGRLGY